MAVTVISNKLNTSAVFHVASSNATLIVAGNNTTSNVAISNEVLTGAYITQIAWGCDGNGHIQILRGSNLVSVYDSSGYVDYAGNGLALTTSQNANLTINFVGSSNSYCIFEVQKVGNFTSAYFQN